MTPEARALLVGLTFPITNTNGLAEAMQRFVAQQIREAIEESWAPTCMKTGTKAVAGVCPEHGGDACLMASRLVEEREACAKIAETLTWRCEPNNADYPIAFQTLIAAAIRARP